MEQQTDNHSPIRLHFTEASAAVTKPVDDDEEAERRRRSRDETTGQLVRFRRWSTRPYWLQPVKFIRAAARAAAVRTFQIPAFEQAAACLAETLDCLNPYYCAADDAYPAEIDADYQPAPDYPGGIDAHYQTPQNCFLPQL